MKNILKNNHNHHPKQLYYCKMKRAYDSSSELNPNSKVASSVLSSFISGAMSSSNWLEKSISNPSVPKKIEKYII